MKETKDWFTDECNSCGESLAKEGIVYVIHSSYVICQGCFKNIKVYLIDIDVDEIHEDDCNLISWQGLPQWDQRILNEYKYEKYKNRNNIC